MKLCELFFSALITLNQLNRKIQKAHTGSEGYDAAAEVDDDFDEDYEGEFDDFYDYAWKTGNLQTSDHRYLHLIKWVLWIIVLSHIFAWAVICFTVSWTHSHFPNCLFLF